MRAAWRGLWLCLVLTASCLLSPIAFTHDLYATATLLIGSGLVATGTLFAMLARLGQPRRMIEYYPVRPSDRETQRWRALLDHAPVPLLYQGLDGALHAANRAARRLFNTDDRLRDPPVHLLDALGQIRPGERRTIRLPQRAGGSRGYALSIAQGSIQSRFSKLVALTDIESELNTSEAQTLRELLQVLSHEIMNSLTPVISLSETACELLDPPADAQSLDLAREAMSTILRRTRGLDRFVSGYRDLARLPAPQLQPTMLQDVFDDAARLFRTRWNQTVRLTVSLPPHAIIARLDAELLCQALLNLLNNGAEAALEGRKNAHAPWIKLEGQGDRETVTIRITDSGDGVPTDHIDHIFRAFFSLKKGGTGVGLSLARQIIQSHGGSLLLEPHDPTHGAEFLIIL